MSTFIGGNKVMGEGHKIESARRIECEAGTYTVPINQRRMLRGNPTRSSSRPINRKWRTRRQNNWVIPERKSHVKMNIRHCPAWESKRREEKAARRAGNTEVLRLFSQALPTNDTTPRANLWHTKRSDLFCLVFCCFKSGSCVAQVGPTFLL